VDYTKRDKYSYVRQVVRNEFAEFEIRKPSFHRVRQGIVEECQHYIFSIQHDESYIVMCQLFRV